MLSTKLSIAVGTMAGTALFGFLFFLPVAGQGQEYDVLIKNGHVIDPKNNIDTIKDVALGNGKIVKMDNDIPPTQSKKTIDATGLYVVPGLIDIHTHVFVGSKADKLLMVFTAYRLTIFHLSRE